MKLKQMSRKAHAKLCGLVAGSSMVVATITPTFAVETNVDKLNKFVTDFIQPWMIGIGSVIAIVGGVQFALGFQREDPEGKSKGLMTVMAGCMLGAVVPVFSAIFG